MISTPASPLTEQTIYVGAPLQAFDVQTIASNAFTVVPSGILAIESYCSTISFTATVIYNADSGSPSGPHALSLTTNII